MDCDNCNLNSTDTSHESKGRLYIFSAPSGAGKTTLCRYVLSHFPDILYSISYTTRAPRPGETDGTDYFFITPDAFVHQIEHGGWAGCLLPP